MADPMRGDKKPPAANFATTSSSASSTVAATNFEYDNENEWDVGIGDLIIDLDADIEKTTTTTLPPSLSSSLKQSASPLVHQVPGVGSPLKPSQAGAATGLLHPNTMAVEHSATVDKGLKMKIKRTQKPSGNKQHEIVKSGGGSSSGPSSAVFNSNAASKDRTGSVENGSDSSSTTGSNSSQGMSQNKKQAASSGPTAVPSHRKGDKKSSLPPSSTPTPYHPPSHCDELLVAGANTPGPPLHPTPGSLASSSTGIQLNNNSSSTSSSNSNSSLSSSGLSLSELHDIRHKQIKTEQKETADVCIGTSVGTITEPECLGPCEPGTSVTLEGIVWHETEGVLVVNVTWRGKTYVGTLLDCTRHDWAPPRFCDSPTSDLDARTTKNSSGAGGAGGGRSSKRGRSSAGANTLGAPGAGGNGGLSGGFGSGDSSFTETRSAKLRNNSGSSSGKDGRDGNSSNGNSSNGTGKDAKSQRRTTNNSNSTGISTGNSGTSSPTPFLPPRPDKRKASKDEASSNSRDSSGNGPNSDTSTKKARNGSPPPTPVLLECPDPNCSKKYKHINGLRYHQNHAHGGVGSTDEDGNSSSSAAPSGETETESTDAEVTDVTADGGDTSLRLPGDSTAPQAGSSQPASTQNSTGPPTSGSGPPPANSQATPGFKIKSPASLLTDVHSLDSSSNQMDASPHNKKKRKLDEEGDELKSHSAGTPGTQTSLDSSTGIQTTGPIPTEPSSPAYSDISDDETRGPQATRFPPTEGLPPGAPYPPYPVAGGPTIAGQTGLPPGANPSSGQDKHDLHKDLHKPGAPNSWNPADTQSVGTQPPTGLSHPISYYPYSLSGGYPYGQVPPGTPGGPSLPPVGPSGAAPPSQPPGGSLPSLGHDKAGPDRSNAADKGSNENHQILKESHEVKTQVLLPGTYQRPGPQDGPGNRFYLYNSPAADNLPGGPNSRPRVKQDPSPHPSPTSGKTVLGLKDIKKERDSEDVKQEGVKPTMETQGPPPAPTSQPYAYIHTGYHLAPGPPYQYGGPDGAAHPPGPPHPMYRGGPLGVLPPHHLLSMHIHPHARYPPSHGPEDLSTPNSEQKGLDMYYQAASQQHKIHELQERALKSPNNAPTGKPHGPQSGPGTPGSNRGPSPASGPGERGPPNSASGPGSTGPAGGGPAPGTPQGKETSGGRRSSSPPPQRHVHTHHHTHVGLGYSILAGQYPAPYGAAAVQAVINQYPPTTK